ncbi:MAG: hypothetical protein JWM76_2894 [Pseudonocardiales bacterium]|nr:hypothetical protein [Pseudonocardiales bacterium]
MRLGWQRLTIIEIDLRKPKAVESMAEEISDSSRSSPNRAQVPELSDGAPDESGLHDSLDKLSRLGMGNGQEGLEGLLEHVAVLAVRSIPGADGAGLTLLEDSRADTMVASAEFVRDVDAIQYGLGEGPCISAADQGRTVRSNSLGSDRSWPVFGPRVAQLGVNSALSLPLISSDGVIGALNVYAFAANAFDDRAVELGELFSAPAAISVQNAQALAQARRLAVYLQGAISSRAVIDQALGIIISRNGGSLADAFEQLRARSAAQSKTVAVTASELVENAVRGVKAHPPGVE